MNNVPHFKRLIIAAYRLPFKFNMTKKGYRAVQNSGGLVSAMLALAEKLKQSNDEVITGKIVWAGTADLPSGNTSPQSFDNELL